MKTQFYTILTAAFLICFSACKKDHVNQRPIADAGMDKTVQLPIDTATLNGSGQDNDGHVVGYVWSQVSGPNTAIIATNGSATTNIRSLVAGTYVFQLLVTDDKGATGIDTVSVNVLPPGYCDIKFAASF